MGILDLSLVTTALLNLLEYTFSLAVENKVADLTFSSQRPDQLKGNAVGLYLFHISEDPRYKNLPTPEDFTAHIRHSSIALQLYYQLVAQYISESDSKDSAIMEQNMTGIAMKTFHDFPIIDEKTKTSRKTDTNDKEEAVIFPDHLIGTGTRLRIELLPIDHKDALNYWSSSQLVPRLAAYYRISVVLLRRESPPTRPDRVLSYGVNTFVGMGPRIDSCSNKLSFKLPGKPATQTLELRPAQVAFGSEVTFHGSGFGGKGTELLFKNNLWGKFYGFGSNWGVKITDNRVKLTIQENITIYDEEGHSKNVKVIPGIYSAKVRAKKKVSLSDGSSKDADYSSNECPFEIVPFLDISNNIIEAVLGDDVEVIGKLFSYKMQLDPNSPDLTEVISIQVYVGQDEYKEGSGSGTFEVEEKKITIHLKNDMKKGSYPLRIFANGVESPPNWITII